MSNIKSTSPFAKINHPTKVTMTGNAPPDQRSAAWSGCACRLGCTGMHARPDRTDSATGAANAVDRGQRDGANGWRDGAPSGDSPDDPPVNGAVEVAMLRERLADKDAVITEARQCRAPARRGPGSPAEGC